MSCRGWHTRRRGRVHRPVGVDHAGQRLGIHGEGCVVRHDPRPVRADAGDAQSLLDARVGMSCGIGDEPCRVAVGVDRTPRRPPPGRQDRDQGRLARRALDHPTTGVARGAEPRRQIEQLAHPVEHQRLELGTGRRGDPAHALHTESGGEQFAEDRRVRRFPGSRRRIGMLPVGEAGHDHPVEVGHEAAKGSGSVGGCSGSAARTSPGSASGWTGCRSTALEVVGDPVDELVAAGAELVGGHGSIARRPDACRSRRPKMTPARGAPRRR